MGAIQRFLFSTRTRRKPALDLERISGPVIQGTVVR